MQNKKRLSGYQGFLKLLLDRQFPHRQAGCTKQTQSSNSVIRGVVAHGPEEVTETVEVWFQPASSCVGLAHAMSRPDVDCRKAKATLS